jgi:O-antigen ligase
MSVLLAMRKELPLRALVALGACSLVSLTAIAMLFARGLLLGLLAGIAVMLVGLRRFLSPGFVVIVAVMIGVPLLEVWGTDPRLAAKLLDRVESIWNPRTVETARSTIQGRKKEWTDVTKALQGSEFAFGRGLGARILIVYETGGIVGEFHNSLAEMLLKTGGIGLALYGVLICQLLVENWRISRSGSAELACLSTIVTAIFVGQTVWGFGTYGLPFKPFYFFLPFFLGLSWRSSEFAREAAYRWATHPRWRGPAPPQPPAAFASDSIRRGTH